MSALVSSHLETEWISEADLRARYSQVRRRLFGSPVSTRTTVAPVLALPPPVVEVTQVVPPAAVVDVPLAAIEAANEAIAPVRRTWPEIVAEVCREHGFTLAQICVDDRHDPVSRCRWEVFFRLRAETRLSLSKIGELLGGFDHTSVLYGVRRHADIHRLDFPKPRISAGPPEVRLPRPPANYVRLLASLRAGKQVGRDDTSFGDTRHAVRAARQVLPDNERIAFDTRSRSYRLTDKGLPPAKRLIRLKGGRAPRKAVDAVQSALGRGLNTHEIGLALGLPESAVVALRAGG